MCGIAGFIQLPGSADSRMAITRMTDALHHRGPDDSGIWVDPERGIALGHRRLAILDLSPAGHQPMASPDGRYILVFNGEIYNYIEIKDELEATASLQWRGTSDTEVMLAAFSRWGVEESTKRFAGMFAFALWDRQEQALWLVRDRMGEKPLYYGLKNGCFLFGSELKALQRHPVWHGEIDRDALALYMRLTYIPAPYTIFQGFKKLVPGTILKLTTEALRTGGMPEPFPYWSAFHAVEYGRSHLFTGSECEAISGLDHVLRNTIRQEMIADVPLGAFLSGGIDSSLVVALMQAQSTRPVRSFTIGFHERDYNEAHNAKAVARYLGTDHTELYITPGEAMGLIPQLPTIFDEPFADVSQIPTFLVAEMTRRHVTVSLSGDGGDELFGGYNRYVLADRIWRSMRSLPPFLRKAIAALMMAPSSTNWDRLFSFLRPLTPSRLQQRQVGNKILKLAALFSQESRLMLYKSLVSHWDEPELIVKNSREPITIFSNNEEAGFFTFAEQMMYLDTISYLPDDILVKVDRACMAVSLESRAPFLDHRVFEFAWSLPLAMKTHGNEGKLLLRKLLGQYLPPELTERPKMGFGVPIDAWLRGPLREWAAGLLDAQRLNQEGYLQPGPIQTKWDEHLSGSKNWQYPLWAVLMFQAWLEKQGHALDLREARE